MTATGDDGRTDERADHLLPEEATAGSDDPAAQAAAVLADSDERQAARDDGSAGDVERRTSTETTEP
jgi:hypothetical protein